MKTFRKVAFTLSEVLIAIGIIGVVAAITMPIIVNTYQKSVVENKLKKFYNTVNQALYRSAADNGGELDVSYILDVSGTANYDTNYRIINTYILPYIKYEKVKKCQISNYYLNAVCVYMSNGDSFGLSANDTGVDIAYCVNCDVDKNVTPENPRKKFWFQFARWDTVSNKKRNSNSIEPYTNDWNGTRDGLKNNGSSFFGGKYSCRKGNTRFEYCTKMIELNGWKIPKDYSW